MFILILVKIGQVLSGGVLMLGQVVIGTVRDTPKLTPTEWELEFKVCRCLGVEAEFFRTVITQAEIFVLDA